MRESPRAILEAERDKSSLQHLPDVGCKALIDYLIEHCVLDEFVGESVVDVVPITPTLVLVDNEVANILEPLPAILESVDSHGLSLHNLLVLLGCLFHVGDNCYYDVDDNLLKYQDTSYF